MKSMKSMKPSYTPSPKSVAAAPPPNSSSVNTQPAKPSSNKRNSVKPLVTLSPKPPSPSPLNRWKKKKKKRKGGSPATSKTTEVGFNDAVSPKQRESGGRLSEGATTLGFLSSKTRETLLLKC
ncbi:hypothetical protein Scep_005095 [Stephania cephalantha]|uniref:Uncharacterized protein n=1 Tax=Stephania cephalantha TaxID=152367 RepID=A0AAP0KTV3_9MAGN